MSKPTDSKPTSGCPMYGSPDAINPDEPNVYGKSDLTYNDYLMVGSLLDLQVPQSSPAHHDEMLFIVIHQAYELWFKLILHEMKNAIHFMEQKEVLRAQHFIKRIVEILKLLVQQIHILETMVPVEFLGFRDHLMPASGFQSSQFREIEFMAGLKDERYLEFFKNRPDYIKILKAKIEAPDLRSAYYSMLGALGYALPAGASDAERAGDEKVREKILEGVLPIYQHPSKDLALYLLSESLVEFDEYLALWREHHVRVVERIIGFKRGSGGSSGVEYLQSTTSKKCFPLLWEVRTRLKK